MTWRMRPKVVLRIILAGLAVSVLLGLLAFLFSPPDFRSNMRLVFLVWLHRSNGQTQPIHIAAKSGNQTELANLLAKNHSLLNIRDAEGETPLHLASREGHLNLVEYLLSQGAKISSKNTQGETPLHHAAFNDQLDIVKLLLARGANPNDEDIAGNSPLNLCARRNKDVVDVLLFHGARPDHIDAWGYSPLQTAVAKNRENNIRILFSHGLQIIPEKDDTLTFLHFSYGKANLRIANLLIEHGANVNAQNKEGSNPLRIAALHGDTNLIQLLLSKGATPDIFVAAGMGDTNRIEQLLKTNPQLIHTHDNDTWTPLHWAAYNNQLEVVRQLLRHGADVNATTECLPRNAMKGKRLGDTPLLFAVMQNHKDLAVELLAHGANVNASGEDNETPLYVASSYGRDELATLLVSKGANLNATNYIGSSPLSIAASRGNKVLVEMLLSHGANVDLGLPLSRAAEAGRKQVAELLLSKGANIEAVDILGYTPIRLAICRQQLELAQLLKSRGAKLDFQSTCALGSVDEIRTILDKNPAMLNQRDQNGWTPLHYAASAGNAAVAELLIDLKSTENHADTPAYSEIAETPLKLAIRKGFQDVFELLLAKGAEVNLRTGDYGLPPLQEAVVSKRKQMVEQLLVHGAHVDTVRSDPGLVPFSSPRRSHQFFPLVTTNKLFWSTALELAATADDRPMIELLLAHGANINAPGSEPLQIAIETGNRDLAEFLIQKGADVNAHAPRHPTLLHYAVRYHQKEMVQLLLSYGANPNVKNLFGETPLDDAITSDQPEITLLLRQQSR
jgi:ankyrin repeat protein